MQSNKFKVAICGGGVGGLTLAVALSQYPDIEVEIFESAKEFSPIGAGIGIWPRIWDALSSIGLEGLASYASSKPTKGMTCPLVLRKSDQAQGYPFCKIMINGALLFFHRADFHEELTKHLPPSCRVQYSKRLSSYTRLSSGKIQISFQNGSTTLCDLLVGADGVKSAVRRILLQEQADIALANGRTTDAQELLSAINPTWSGTVAYRSLIPVEKLSGYVVREHGTQYLGKDWAIIVYPIAKGALLNFVGYHMNNRLAETPFEGPWISDANKDDLITWLSHWEPELVNIIKSMNKPTKWAIHTVKPLPSFGSDGVALLGDAAHAMTPHQGSGAGQAIEDACVLASLLGHRSASLETLPHVIRIYDALRRPFAQDIARRSFNNGSYLSMNHEGFNVDGLDDAAQARVLKEMGETIVNNWEWTWTTPVDDMIQEGLHMLEDAIRQH